MSNKRLSELTELQASQLSGSDLILTTDLSVLESKKLRVDSLQNFILNNGKVTGSITFSQSSLSASFASASLSASYALSASYSRTASYALNSAAAVVSGASYNISASWASQSLNTISASYSRTSSYSTSASSSFVANTLNLFSRRNLDVGTAGITISPPMTNAIVATSPSTISLNYSVIGQNITSSWSSQSISASISNKSLQSAHATASTSASYALTSSYSTLAKNSKTASYSVTSNIANYSYGSDVSLTSNNALYTSSYAKTASVSAISNYTVSSSYSTNSDLAITASYALNSLSNENYYKKYGAFPGYAVDPSTEQVVEYLRLESTNPYGNKIYIEAYGDIIVPATSVVDDTTIELLLSDEGIVSPPTVSLDSCKVGFYVPTAVSGAISPGAYVRQRFKLEGPWYNINGKNYRVTIKCTGGGSTFDVADYIRVNVYSPEGVSQGATII